MNQPPQKNLLSFEKIVKNMDIVSINGANNYVYCNLSQIYEGEFAPLTGEYPNKAGLYKIQTEVVGSDESHGYLLYKNNVPAGFMVLKELETCFDVAEFFILPIFRRKKLGLEFAHSVMKRYKGLWQVRQIEGADYATEFWIRVIQSLVKDNFKMSVVNDREWGRVTKQEFYIK